MTLFNASDKELIKRRKAGSGLLELFEYQCSIDPYLDELVNLAHIVRICSESNLPFYRNSVLKIVSKYHKLKFHGIKGSYLFSISGFLRGKKKKLAILTEDKGKPDKYTTKLKIGCSNE
jgi:hypothetical protein